MTTLAIPDFVDKAKLIDWLIANKSTLIQQKKSAVKYADSISYVVGYVDEKTDTVIKAETIPAEATKIKVRSIVNTTKLFDSHGDVHIDQLWNKSIKDNRDNYLVQEHEFNFKGIISDNVKVFTKQIPWHDLGFNYEGNTQALIYDSIVERKSAWPLGTDMFEMYRTGKVKNHSVGMRYVKIELAVNDDRYEKEFGVWEKYFDEIVNKDEVLEVGYFWAVTEAKNIEGSAVVRGSNWATPTQSIQQVKAEPVKATPKKTEPVPATLKASELMKYYQPLKNVKQ
jgi:hypothetical protein